MNNELIKINTDIGGNISTTGYCVTLSDAFFINAKLINDMLVFINSYNNLKVDQYVLEKEGYPYRERRYTGLDINLDTKKITKNSEQTFFQSSKVNKSYGGIVRTFAPLTQEIINNSFLRELIITNLLNLPSEDISLHKKWYVGVHMIRVVASKNFIGHPAPEGIHQDEHHFIAQHFINKSNVTGGKSAIYTLEKEKLASLTFNNIMDSCYFNDEKVMHDVSTIECKNSSKTANRDMLILAYKKYDK